MSSANLGIGNELWHRGPGPDPIHLDRRLGPLDAAATIVSNVIGGGILFTPPQIAESVPHAWLFLSTWVAGGLLAFAGAMAYAELSPGEH